MTIAPRQKQPLPPLRDGHKKISRKDAKTQRNFLASLPAWREYSSGGSAETYASVYKGERCQCYRFPGALSASRTFPTFRGAGTVQVSPAPAPSPGPPASCRPTAVRRFTPPPNTCIPLPNRGLSKAHRAVAGKKPALPGSPSRSQIAGSRRLPSQHHCRSSALPTIGPGIAAGRTSHRGSATIGEPGPDPA